MRFFTGLLFRIINCIVLDNVKGSVFLEKLKILEPEQKN